MRLVIDLQGCQGSNSKRGIGRYAMALTRQLILQRGQHDVIVVLNDLLPDHLESIRATFEGMLSPENIVVWQSAGPVASHDPTNDARRKTAEVLREAFLATLNPDVVLNTSLFEGLSDDAAVSIGSFSAALPTAVVLYDLIPWIHRDVYLSDPAVQRWYLNKLEHLRRADFFLAISASSAQEAISHLDWDERKVVNISTACDDHFHAISITSAHRLRLKNTYAISRPFVMYTGGIDHRKNIEGLIRAYALLQPAVRAQHQLVVVCSAHLADVERLQQLATDNGLVEGEMLMTGFVADEDLVLLYNACKAFVFPSWHEGFGLPALEAMSCGRAVIGSRLSSIPEVVGLEEALFDPFDDSAIAAKLSLVLTDSDFRTRLEQHSVKQSKKFAWKLTGSRAWSGLEDFHTKNTALSPAQLPIGDACKRRRPRLAYFSPLPPEPSGISDYSADLLPVLSQHYEIDVIVAQENVTDAWVLANCAVRNIAWFRQHADRFERVMYHFGNSEFHSHMFDLLGEFPGVVVLHDFFLSGIVAHRDLHQGHTYSWPRSLAHDHGWRAVEARYKAVDTAEVVYAYPCNLEVLQKALGVIVHSSHSSQLADSWYGSGTATDWRVIPLLRVPVGKSSKAEARKQLGLAPDDFIVCSFGHLGPTKLNDRLLTAWLASPLAGNPKCRLVFVGQNQPGGYGAKLVQAIRSHSSLSPIEITGWNDSENYRRWLSAADAGVQLRTLSRGETSAAVLDCMNHGLPTIVNANGSMADLSPDSVCLLPDEFSDDQLSDALTMLWQNLEARQLLGVKARQVILNHHQPRPCAEQYRNAIEHYYRSEVSSLPAVFNALAQIEPALAISDQSRVVTALSNNFPPLRRRKQLLLDVSELVQRDVKSGIQRVVRAFLYELLNNPPAGFSIEPVYATEHADGYRYAKRFTSRFMGFNDAWSEDQAVDIWAGDVFLGLDLQPVVVPAQKRCLREWHRRGVKVHFVIYDLLPVLLPEFFNATSQAMHMRWLEAVSSFDAVLCISKSVADQMHDWLQMFGSKRERPLALHWFHLGADVESSVPTKGMPDASRQVLMALQSKASFLMVGTLEPRKGHAQTLAAFERLWNDGVEATLVIVGKQGWLVEALVEKIRHHAELGNQLVWLEGISDEYLDKIYTASSCLIAASEGEGFGLPLIEAAQHKLPIIARDIAVFREVAGESAYYFENIKSPDVLASAIQKWLQLHRLGQHPRSNDLPWLTWSASGSQLVESMLRANPYKTWLPDGIRRFWGADARFHTQVGRRDQNAMRSTGKTGFLIFGPYEPFEAGTYQLVIEGIAGGALKECWVDVTSDRGATMLLRMDLPNPVNQDNWLMSVSLMLKKAVPDLEVRIWVSASASLALRSITLTPTKWSEKAMAELLNKATTPADTEETGTAHAARSSRLAHQANRKSKKSKRG